MSNAFEQHARANGAVVVMPGLAPDLPTVGGNTDAQPAGRVGYDQGMPGAVSSSLFHITVNPDNFEESQRGDASAGGNDRSVDITRYIDQNVGGSTGAVIGNGYTSGINQYWNRHSFRGRAVQFQSAQDASIRPGPVGRVNYSGNLAAGVDSQFTIMPSLEDIYRSIAGRT
jgi:hypothetical protein